MITVMHGEDGETTARPVTEISSSLDLGRGADFDAFCRREYAAVTGLAYVLTGDWADAEDLSQDAFFAAFRRWAALAEYDDVGAWVRRVVANRAVSRRRRLGSEARALTRLGGRRPPGPAHAEIPEYATEVWAIVRRLPARQAQVFALTYVEDLSLDQVAAVLGISAGTAKTHLTRARVALTSSGNAASTNDESDESDER